MSIIIRDLNGKSININTKRIDSIQSLKEKIYSRTGIHVNDQVLTFSGKHLEDYKKLYEYNILRNNILNLSMRLIGGIVPNCIFINGSPNTDSRTATVGSLFSFEPSLYSANSCLGATISASPTPLASIITNITDGVLTITGTPGGEDVGSYTITITCTSATGSYLPAIDTFQFNLTVSGDIPCIVSGQKILTPNGYKLIDNIYNGDMITTSQNKDVVALNYTKKFEFTTNETAPYIIPKDSINPSYPPKDIFLSAEHRIKTNYNWVTPKELSKYNSEVRQINIGKPVTYYNIETPNSATDHLILEGTTVASYRFPGSENFVNIHDNL